MSVAAKNTAPDVLSAISQASFETERGLIGALLLYGDPVLIRAAAAVVGPEHFSDKVMARLFHLINGIADEGLSGFPATHRLISVMRGDVEALAMDGWSPSKLIAHCCAHAYPALGVEGAARQVKHDHLALRLRSAVEQGDTETAESCAAEMERLSKAHLNTNDSFESIGAVARRMTDAMNAAHMEGKPPRDFAHCGLRDLARAIGGWRSGKLYIIAGRPGMGKEQPVDTPVLTPFGWKVMGGIRPGDLVVGRTGFPTKVLSVHPQGIKQSYQVNFSDGSCVECGLDHLWTVSSEGGRGRNKEQTLSVKELLAKGLTRDKGANRVGAKWRVPIVGPVAYETASPLPIHPYVLGVLIGDGALSGRDIRFSNPDLDCDIRGVVFAFIQQMDVHLVENRSGACPYFSIRGIGARAFRSHIKGLGLNVLSGEKFIPKSYLFASEVDRVALLMGLMDTDGSSKSGKTTFYTTSRQLAHDVVSLTQSLGGVARISTYDRSKDNKSTEYVVRLRTAFNPFMTARKAAGWKKPPVSRYIQSIVPVRMTEQVCIMVEAQDGLYVTKDFIVTHNTTLTWSTMLRTALKGHGVMVFSLEMGRDELGEMALTDLLWRRGQRIEYREINVSQAAEPGYQQKLEAVLEVAPIFNSLPLMIYDRGGVTMAEIRSQAMLYDQRLRGEGRRLEVIVIDHLGLIKASGTYAGNKVAETEEVSGQLKQLAKELNCAVVALAQLSRQVEGRDDKRPNLSDLRWSGAIEQDADVVMFVYREEYYLKKVETDADKEMKRQARLNTCRNKLEVLIEKQRGGPTYGVELFCDVGCSVVRDLERD